MTGSLQIRRGTYHCVLNFKDEMGKRKQKWINTKLEAKGNKKRALQMLNDLLAQNSDIDFHKINEILFADYIMEWLESKKGHVENNTWKSYETLVVTHIVPYFKPMHLKVKEIKPKHIMDFYECKSKSGRLDGKDGGVSRRVLKYFSTIFCQVFKKAILEQIIDNHPSINVPIPKEIETPPVWKFLESGEVEKVINAFEGHLLKPVIVIALYYGLRRSEVLGLKWDSINFEKNIIEIKHTVLRYGSSFEERDRTKNKSSRRTLGLIPGIKKMLLNLKLEQNSNKKLFSNAYYASDYIFTWPDGKLIKPDYITRTFPKVLEENGLEKLRFHDLRHSCASLLHANGVDMVDIKAYLGHSAIQTTERYTHISDKQKETTSRALESTFAFTAG